MRVGLVAGHNVDAVNVCAGLQMLDTQGDFSDETKLVVEYSLVRWQRGEEEQAERGAIDQNFHGIDFATWRMVLASAIASAEGK